MQCRAGAAPDLAAAREQLQPGPSCGYNSADLSLSPRLASPCTANTLQIFKVSPTFLARSPAATENSGRAGTVQEKSVTVWRRVGLLTRNVYQLTSQG